jgi:TonB family protein
MPEVLAMERRVHFPQIVESLSKWNAIILVAVVSLVAFAVGWIGGHIFRPSASADSGLNWPAPLQVVEKTVTVTPEVRPMTNTSRIKVGNVNKHRAAGSWKTGVVNVRRHTDAKIPIPQHTRSLLASSFASLDPSQADSDVNKATAPSATVPSDGAGNILPSSKLPDCSPIAPPPTKVSAAASPDSWQPGALIHKIDPQYPPVALAQKLEGTVKIYAVTSPDGSMKTIRPLSGPRILIQAALEAVRQWRYSPTLLSGQPVESQRYITVAFQITKTS